MPEIGTSSFDEPGRETECRPAPSHRAIPRLYHRVVFTAAHHFGRFRGKTDIDGRVAMTQSDANGPELPNATIVAMSFCWGNADLFCLA